MDVQSKSHNYIFKFAIIALLIFYLPLLLNHSYFRDDWHRATEEFANFRPLGRVFGGYFLHFLTSDYQGLTETTPLFQIVSILIIASSLLIIVRVRNINITPLTMITIVAFIFNPFFIESLLYRYDSLTMTIALMSGVIAWAYFVKKPIISALFLILSLGTYQPLVNVFILLAIAEFSYRLLSGEDIKAVFILLLRYCLVFFIALVIYRLAIIPAYSVKTGRSAFIDFDRSGLWMVLEKIKVTLSIYPGFLSLTGKIIYGFGCLIAVFGMIKLCKNNKCSQKKMRFFLAVFFMLIAFPLSYGPFLLLADSAVGPRVLSPMIVFSMILIFYTCYYFFENRKIWLTYIFATFFLMCPLSFSYMANNAIANQESFEDFISKDAAQEILRNFTINDVVLIDGHLPYAPLVSGGVNRYTGIKSIVTPAEPWMLQLRLQSLGVKNIFFEWVPHRTQELRRQICLNKSQPAISSQYFKFYSLNNQLFVWFGEQPMCAD